MQHFMQLTYFPLWAKGPGPALALAHSGLRWRGVFPEDWASLKPQTAWSKLPILQVDNGPSSLTVAHELAIMSYIGRAVPEMGGTTDSDFTSSLQVMCECEDIYAKLTKFQPTTRQPEKCPPRDLNALWSASDSAAHNRDQGLQINLENLNAFARLDGRFSSTGTVTVGDCKLFATLHTLSLIEPDVLIPHARLRTFYDRFSSLDATAAVLENGGNFPGPFQQYFIRGEGQP
jgi:glutathione S-transferase